MANKRLCKLNDDPIEDEREWRTPLHKLEMIRNKVAAFIEEKHAPDTIDAARQWLDELDIYIAWKHLPKLKRQSLTRKGIYPLAGFYGDDK